MAIYAISRTIDGSFEQIIEHKEIQFESLLKSWFKDKNEPFAFRKKLFMYLWTYRNQSFANLLEYLDFKEQLVFMKSFKNQDILRMRIVDDIRNLSLMINFRENEEIRNILIVKKHFDDHLIISKILNAKDISNEMAMYAISKIIHGSFEQITEYKDVQFKSILKSWLKDKNGPFVLRKKLFMYLWIKMNQSFVNVLEYLDLKEQLVFMKSFRDKHDLIIRIVDDFKNASLIVKFRDNKKIRKMLIVKDHFDYNVIVSKILDAKDISNEIDK